MDLEEVVGSVVTRTSGMELVELTLRREGGGKILRVTVDREQGLDLDTISEISKRISRRLDAEGFDPGPYSLEVSSPGVERALRRPEDFAKRIGERVKVKTSEPVEGSHVHVGALTAADDLAVTVETEGGERRLRFADIAAARTVFEWGAQRRKGKGKK
ncbi:MAG: ribosome maturation factor RimP [Actinomycetota bacterium]